MNHLDPVCGRVLRPVDTVASAPHEANLYHFCSEECHARFWANPTLYIQPESNEEDFPRTPSTGSRATPLPWHRTE
jgi:Cu+-exporting ATPase